MSVSERIYEEVTKLPEPLQAEVLNFVQYLAAQVNREIPDTEELSYSAASLSMAMRGMEGEDTPAYSIEDLQEAFS
jgi:hypothetical protein